MTKRYRLQRPGFVVCLTGMSGAGKSTLARNGAAVIAAAISPYAEARREVCDACARDGIPFVEVDVRADLERLIARDVKGLHRRALRGEIPQFTGVSDPYEALEEPDLAASSDRETVAESLERILAHLRSRGLLQRAATPLEVAMDAGGIGREVASHGRP